MTGLDIDAAFTGDPEVLAQAVQPLLPRDAKLKEIINVRNDRIWPETASPFYSDCVTLRIEFDNANERPEQEKKAAAAKMLSDFTAASAVNWTGTRALTRVRLPAGELGMNNYR